MGRIAGILAAVGVCALWARAQAPAVVYKISTVAGSASIGDGGPATMAQIGNIQGIAVDRLGEIYLSDTDKNLIRKIDAKGAITTIAGTGAAGFGGDSGPATLALLNLPYGLAADLAGNVYIADLNNQRVRRIAPDGSIVTVAGTGVKGSLGDGGLAVNAQLMSPRNVAVDGGGNLYISEFEGHRIRRVTPDGKITTIAGTGISGFRGDGGLAVTAQIAYPAGLALDRTGALYIADSGNQRIRKLIPGGIIATVAGGSQNMPLLTPVAVAVDNFGDLFAADTSGVLHEATPGGAWLPVAGTGLPGFSGDGGPASKAQIVAPRDLAFDLSWNLYVADDIRIRQINSSNVIQTIAGDGFLHAVGDGGSATGAILNAPTGLALDRSGNLFIADTGTERVRMVSAVGVISTFAGTGVAGFNGDLLPGPASSLYSPMGVLADIYGNIFIADTFNHRIRKGSLQSTISTFAGTGTGGDGADGQAPIQVGLRGPRGVCETRTGIIYIVDTANNRVLSVPPGGVAITIAGNGTAGFGGDGGPARTAELNQPSACAVDSAGNVFIADTLNNRIARVDTNGVISTAAGTGQAGTSTDGVAATSAALNQPLGVVVDDNGDIFVTDTGNNLIRQVTPNGTIYTIAGQGGGGFSGDGGMALMANLNSPAGILLDGSGALYFADRGNNRVRRLVPQAAPPVSPPPVTTLPTLTAVNGASLVGGPISPGEIVTIYGSGLGPVQGVTGTFNSNGLLANLLGGSEVLFDGVAAPVFYAQAGQLNVQAPYTMAGQTTTHVQVQYQGQAVATADLAVAAAAPAIFPTVLDADGTLNSAANPAAQGSILTFFATGEGVTTGANIAGQTASPPYAQPTLPVTLVIAGAPAQLLYAGEAPGLIGMLQVNAQLPASMPSGGTSAVLTVGVATSPAVQVWTR